MGEGSRSHRALSVVFGKDLDFILSETGAIRKFVQMSDMS